MAATWDDAPCRECGHGRAAHAGGGCSRCTCPAFSGAAGRRSFSGSPRADLLAFVAGAMTEPERERFLTVLADAHGDRGVAGLPEDTCARYLAELRRRQASGEPLVRG